MLLMFFGIALQHRLVLVDRLLSHTVVVFGVGAGNVLLGKGGRQIETGIQQAGIERDRLLEVIDRFFVLGVLVGLHALVELVARSQLVAARAQTISSNPTAMSASIRTLVFIAL